MAGECTSLETYRPHQAGFRRHRLRVDVVAVQRVSHLEPKGVARGEPGRLSACVSNIREEAVPRLHCLLGPSENLVANLTGVPRACDQDLPVPHRVHVAQVLRCRIERLDDFPRPRSLDGEGGPVHDPKLYVYRCACAKLLEHCVPIRGVGYDEVFVHRISVDDQVVDDPPIAVADEAVARAPDGEVGHPVGELRVEEAGRPGARNEHLAQMGDVEEPGSFANGVVLGDRARV